MPMVPRNSPGQGVTMVPGGSQATQICMALAIEWPSGTHLASVVAHTLGVCTGPNCSRAAQATQICMALVETLEHQHGPRLTAPTRVAAQTQGIHATFGGNLGHVVVFFS